MVSHPPLRALDHEIDGDRDETPELLRDAIHRLSIDTLKWKCPGLQR
jgi:hypothetical protein